MIKVRVFILGMLGCAVAALISSCAQIRGISGGEKDTTPPTLTSSSPENFSTRFNSKTITLEFDEYVQLNNVQQELIVSPPPKVKPLVRLRDKKVSIELRDALLPNTTYTFNFGKGIVDVNEANSVNNLLYVFSTGDKIDSLAVSGKVEDAWERIPVAGIKLMLYDSMSQENPYTKNPYYFSRSADDGSFTIPYLHEGNYQMIALEDLNDNFRLDGDERMAFLNETVSPTVNDSSLVKYPLRLSKMRPEKPRLVEYDVDSAGVLKIPWDEFYGALQMEPIASDGLDWVQWFDAKRDTAYLWLSGLVPDAYINTRVIWNNEILDTLEVPFFTEALSDSIELRNNISSKWKKTDNIIITAEEFLFLNVSAVVKLLEDSNVIDCRIENLNEGNKYGVEAKFKDGKKYELTIFPGTFTNALSATNDTTTIFFQTYRMEDLGQLNMNVSGLIADSVYQIILEKPGSLSVKQNLTSDGPMVFQGLIPGEYSLRLFADSEIQNGLWDPAAFNIGRQPEPVWVYPQKITVRANWELNLDWKLED
ncbi:MAG: Ig-like domain-containing protein [Flavobacteriales bacterium]|nr:Ig-like domain-containing protein [Flavobacteriales bacterium]